MITGFGVGGGWPTGISVALGAVLLIVLLYRVFGGPARRLGRGSRGAERRLLEERYARGEVTSEEYQERLRALGGGG